MIRAGLNAKKTRGALVPGAGQTFRQVRLELIDAAPAVGDYVIVHAGFAIRRLDREDAIETIKLFQEGLNLELL